MKIYYKVAILDTSVLIVLYHLGLLDYLNLFYNLIRIPREVEKEFLTKHPNQQERSKRFEFLTLFYEKNKSWFVRCNEYNTMDVELYKSQRGIDAGEAEVFAQNQALGNNHEILLDEKQARSFAKSNKIHHHGVLFILANMDIKFKICDYYDSIEKVRKEMKTYFSDEIIDKVYKDVCDNWRIDYKKVNV